MQPVSPRFSIGVCCGSYAVRWRNSVALICCSAPAISNPAFSFASCSDVAYEIQGRKADVAGDREPMDQRAKDQKNR